MGIHKRREDLRKKQALWRARIKALEIKENINGTPVEKLVFMIKLISVKAQLTRSGRDLPDSVGDMAAAMLYADILMHKISGTAVTAGVLCRCIEGVWLDYYEVEELLDRHDDSRRWHEYRDWLRSTDCDAGTEFGADELLHYTEERLRIDIGIDDG